MKNTLLHIFVGLIFLMLFVYVLSTYSPYDQNKINEFGLDQFLGSQMEISDNINRVIDYGVLMKILDQEVIFIVLGLWFGTLFFLLSGIHQFIDKFFFRKYSEKPDSRSSYRRAILIYLTSISLLWFRVVAILNWVNLLSLILLIIVIEFIFIKKPWKKS